MKDPINLGQMACNLSKHLPRETTDEELIGICAWLASFAMWDNDRRHLLNVFLEVVGHALDVQEQWQAEFQAELGDTDAEGLYRHH